MIQARVHHGSIEVQEPIPPEWEGQLVKIEPLTPDDPIPDLEERLAALHALGPVELDPEERAQIAGRWRNWTESARRPCSASRMNALERGPLVMDEKSFWVSLEFRLCGEFAGLPERRYQYFWCDGLHPSQYLLDDPVPRICGKAWIGNGDALDEWSFTLLLPHPFASQEEIDWASLLPPANVTCWMAFDEGRRYIEIEPAIAVPDLTKPR